MSAPPSSLSTGESQTAQTIGLEDLPVSALQSQSQSVAVEASRQPWGRLFPMSALYGEEPHCLFDDEVTVGRGEDCGIVLVKNISGSRGTISAKYYKAYSKVHFKLTRNRTSTGCFTFVEDCSSNGTFINGAKLGKGTRQFLANNDEIAICHVSNRSFVYMETVDEKENVQMPAEISCAFTMGKVLGSGAYGEVRLAFDKRTCRRVAVKIINKEQLLSEPLGGVESRYKGLSPSLQTRREIEILRAISHPCVIGIELVSDSPLAFYLVLELAEGGDLHTRLKNNRGPLGERLTKIFFLQIASAVDYLHSNGVTHRDLKPENILLMTLDSETVCKVTDFGLAKLASTMSSMTTFCGTPLFVAPEVIRAQGGASYTSAVDLWSLGVLLYFCLASDLPFHEGRADLPLSQQILLADYSFPPTRWSSISFAAKSLVGAFLQIDPRRRVTAGAALNAEWLDDAATKDVVDGLVYGGRVREKSPSPQFVPRALGSLTPDRRCVTPSVGDRDADENGNDRHGGGTAAVDRPADEIVAAANFRIKRPSSFASGTGSSDGDGICWARTRAKRSRVDP